MERDTRRPVRMRRKKRTVPSFLLLLLTAALLLIFLQFHRINAQLEGLRARLRQIERTAGLESETESEPLPDAGQAEDYLDMLPVLDVGKPVDRTEAEVLECLRELGRDDPVIAGIADHSGAYPTALLTALANNPEMADFAAGYPAALGKSAMGQKDSGAGAAAAEGGSGGQAAFGLLTETERAQACPLLLQWDPRWGYHAYGSGSCVALSGCGPACLSMVLFSLLRDGSLTPDRIADYSMENGYYVPSTGTAWALMEDLPKEYGIRVSTPSLSEAAMKALLDNGALFICAMSRGDFTLSGHFIVIRGYDEQGFLVNDPNCLSKSRRHWTFSRLKPQIKGIWAYTEAQAQTAASVRIKGA